jgi:YVTN family beta-propeller protein
MFFTGNRDSGTSWITKSSNSVLATDDLVVGQSNIPRPGISVSGQPISLAVNPNTDTIYTANWDTATVSVIDGSKDEEVRTIKVGENPNAVDVNPHVNKIFVANSGSLTVSMIDGQEIKESDNITLDDYPSNLVVNPDQFKVYVLDMGGTKIDEIGIKQSGKELVRLHNVTEGLGSSGSIQDMVISPDGALYISNGNGINPIDPASADPYANRNHLYANHVLNNADKIVFNRNGTILYALSKNNLVGINVTTNKTLTNIPIFADENEKSSFSSLEVNPTTGKVYVSYPDLDRVFVIDPTKRKVNSIVVGDEPTDIAVNPKTNKIYVANYASRTVSIIHGELDKLLSKVSFNINPPNSGHIICGNQEITTNIYNRIEFSTHCNAENNDGFRFNSWTEELGRNARRSINTSSIADTPINSLKNALGFKTNDTSRIFTISKFGNFTANFNEIPPPIPTQYWIALYGIITSSIIGWSIPSISGWIRSRRQSSNLRQYANTIDSLHKKLNQSNSEELQSLDKISSDITNTYAEGKMNETHYEILKNKISDLKTKLQP